MHDFHQYEKDYIKLKKWGKKRTRIAYVVCPRSIQSIARAFFFFINKGLKICLYCLPRLIWIKTATESFQFQWAVCYSKMSIPLFLIYQVFSQQNKEKTDDSFFLFFWLLFNERTGGKHGIQRAFCKVQKQVKLREDKRRIGGLKDRWVVRGSRKMKLGNGLHRWAVGLRVQTGVIPPQSTLFKKSVCLQRGAACLVPTKWKEVVCLLTISLHINTPG